MGPPAPTAPKRSQADDPPVADPAAGSVAESGTVGSEGETGGVRRPWLRILSLVAGPLVGAIAATATWQSLGPNGSLTLALLLWMAVWWLTLAADLATTALLPALLLPAVGISTPAQALAPYADGIIFLFAGGFVIALALERHGLSDRFARAVLAGAGTSAPRVIAALLVATAALSAFVSNTATAAAMLPIAVALAASAERQATLRGTAQPMRDAVQFRSAAVLAVAYAASIGGVMTLVGSPPNAIAASAIAERTGEPISFVSWLRYGLPIGAILLVATWFVLCHGVFRLRAVAIDPLPAESRRPFTAASRATLAIFALTVLAWLTRPLWARLAPGVRDESIAVAAAILLLVLPTRLHPFETLLDWRDLKRLPWGVLILFGGGLSIAAALEHHGVAAWLAADMRSLGDAPMIVVLLILAAGACFGSELASNTALTATAMPVLAALADAGDMPLERLAVTGALGASLAFMLPVGTPPNAMAYATGHVSSGQMAKAGFLLNLAAIATVILVVTLMP